MSSTAPRLPDLIARRGNAAEYPENTLPALRSALDLGVSYVQIDVQLTADHVPILLHDSSLKRTAGVDRNVHELTWSELGDVRVNEQERFQNRFTDVGVPSLSQAAGLLATFAGATAFVQIHRSSLRSFGTELTIRRVLDAVKPVGRQCVVISNDLAAVHHIRQISPYRIGWVLSEYSNLSALKTEALAPDYVFCEHTLLTASHSRLWRGPWRWAVYEVNQRKLAVDLALRDVRLVATSHVRDMLREYRGLRTTR